MNASTRRSDFVKGAARGAKVGAIVGLAIGLIMNGVGLVLIAVNPIVRAKELESGLLSLVGGMLCGLVLMAVYGAAAGALIVGISRSLRGSPS